MAGTMTKKAGGAFRKVKSFISRQYDALLHLDFQDKTNRTILKVVVINFLLLCVVCAFWYYGIFALIVYSCDPVLIPEEIYKRPSGEI